MTALGGGCGYDEQLTLVDLEPTGVPADPYELVRAARLIFVNSSAGKDSQAMLDYVVEIARKVGAMDRITVIHNDLGTTDDGIPVEWPGTLELAREQAEHYGLEFVVTRRERGGLFQQIRERGKFPGPGLGRWCTSDQKTSQAMKVVTRKVSEYKKARGLRPNQGPPVEVLYCVGIRAEESTGRAGKPVIGIDEAHSNSRRTVTRWHPILDWSVADVWARIAKSGVRHHWAYDLGMTRLSCSLCVLASRPDLECAARHRQDLVEAYVSLEAEIGHQFRADMSARELQAAGAGFVAAPPVDRHDRRTSESDRG